MRVDVIRGLMRRNSLDGTVEVCIVRKGILA